MAMVLILFSWIRLLLSRRRALRDVDFWWVRGAFSAGGKNGVEESLPARCLVLVRMTLSRYQRTKQSRCFLTSLDGIDARPRHSFDRVVSVVVCT